jgi:hypothetical protein
MKEALILRGDRRRCREHWLKKSPITPFFDNVDNAVKFLRHERLSSVVVYAPDVGSESRIMGLGYFLKTELVP